VPFRFAILTILLGVLLSAGIAVAGQAAGSSAKPQSARSPVTITDQDNSTNVDLTTGELLVVKLPSNPSTGYDWSVSGDPAPLKLTKHSHLRSTSGAVGAPQTAVFEFRAASAGVVHLTLLYRRSWEYNVPPVKTFTVTVEVR